MNRRTHLFVVPFALADILLVLGQALVNLLNCSLPIQVEDK